MAYAYIDNSIIFEKYPTISHILQKNAINEFINSNFENELMQLESVLKSYKVDAEYFNAIKYTVFRIYYKNKIIVFYFEKIMFNNKINDLINLIKLLKENYSIIDIIFHHNRINVNDLNELSEICKIAHKFDSDIWKKFNSINNFCKQYFVRYDFSPNTSREEYYDVVKEYLIIRYDYEFENLDFSISFHIFDNDTLKNDLNYFYLIKDTIEKLITIKKLKEESKL